MFYGKSHEHIKNVFDSSFPYITLPADLDIKITNSNNQVNFKKVNFGGKNKDGLAYGPNPIRFIAGRPQLTPGKYVVDIKTNEIREDIAQLDIYFFASIPQKIKCGKFKKLEK
uniref:Uncharacterized protein n=1 Tax=Candidatus Kentrum sp. LFY TaxID=2126342 RepID=A0A450WRY6_9GAMM|nr:MAG: hypothetical protein BECKLFY1418C_GA0070996_106310 [Candidatus Kentron sp. LFY]